MIRLQKCLSERQKRLLGLRTPHTLLRQNYLLRGVWFLVLCLPWVAVLLCFAESWRSYSVGDSVSVPLWAWCFVVLLPILAALLARMAANRIIFQYIIRKRTRHSGL